MSETPTHAEIQAVVGDLLPQAAARALAAHLGIDIQAAYDMLDGFYWRGMWDAIGDLAASEQSANLRQKPSHAESEPANPRVLGD